MDDNLKNQIEDSSAFSTLPAPVPTPPTSTPDPPVAPVKGKYKLPQAFKTALVLFGLAASVVLISIPTMLKGFSDNATPNFVIFLLAGVVGIAVTAIIFNRINKLGLGFSKTVIVMAIGYNALIAIVKLLLAPMALYMANQTQDFVAGGLGGGDPNTMGYYAFVGAIILVLYCVAFYILYRHFKRQFAAKATGSTTRGAIAVLVTLLSLLLAGGAGIMLLPYLANVFGFVIFPLLVIGPTINYLGYVFSTVGITIVVALLVAFLLAYWSFAEVEKQAIQVGDATILASFFWVGLSLILLYHVMWMVFMITLVTTWPFKTYTPK